MRKSEFIELPRGIAGRRTWASNQSLILLHGGELCTKRGNNQPAQLEFQQSAVESVTRVGRCAFRGAVAADFHFYSLKKDPPAIQSLPKFYLDLLQAPIDAKALGFRRGRIILTDDRQVSILSASYTNGLTNSITGSCGDFGHRRLARSARVFLHVLLRGLP